MQILIKSKIKFQLHQDFLSAEILTVWFDWQICITLSLLVHVKAVQSKWMEILYAIQIHKS